MMCYARYADRAVCATPTPIRCESRGLCAPEMTRFSDRTQRRGAQHRYIYMLCMLCYVMLCLRIVVATNGLLESDGTR